jgi:hypothetical protein
MKGYKVSPKKKTEVLADKGNSAVKSGRNILRIKTAKKNQIGAPFTKSENIIASVT